MLLSISFDEWIMLIRSRVERLIEDADTVAADQLIAAVNGLKEHLNGENV